MKRVMVVAVALVVVLAQSASAGGKGQEQLDSYLAKATPEQVSDLSHAGYDVVSLQDGYAELVLTKTQRNGLKKAGFDIKLKRDKNGRTDRERALLMSEHGYDVWRSFDEAGGIRNQLHDLAARYPDLIKLEVIGYSTQGRELIALKVTNDAVHEKDGKRPAVLYSSLQHAREWISGEVTRRMLMYYLDKYRAGDSAIRNIVDTTELWFYIVANPDGYQYTFDHERLWRKTLADNDGDGQITSVDGVDPNRNFDSNWAYDNEGSSPFLTSETYRGLSAASEPETRALQGLLKRVEPRFQSNYHSTGRYILYPQGWSVGTLDADNPIYAALAGTPEHPAIEGFNPGQSADVLYVTNGETTDYASTHSHTIAFTPELGEGTPGAGFVFPDNEALIQAEFARTIPFNLSLARSAAHPADPDSAVGMTTKPFYLDQTGTDPRNAANSMFDFRFTESYGTPQEVRVLARRDIGEVTLRYQINGGAVKDANTKEWKGGDRYGPGGATYYHVVGGDVKGARPGDTVKVWFEAGKDKDADKQKKPRDGFYQSPAFSYRQISASGRRVLVLSAEDYTGASPSQDPSGPHYLTSYLNALAANGIAADVYDVDAHLRTAPSPLGVLGHYDAVVWYTGDDIITREAGWTGGNASALAEKELLSIRDYLNEGGRVLYTGKYAGHQYGGGDGFGQLYDPVANEECRADPAVKARCVALVGAGDGLNDSLQYWFGVGTINEDAGYDPETGDQYGLISGGDPFGALGRQTLNGADSADNQSHSASFLTLSGLLPVDQFPLFASTPALRWDRTGGPYSPHTGDHYAYSHIGDKSYKRVMRTIDVPSGGGSLSFWTSYDIEGDWDQLFVEAHTVGQNDWTTLPDANGNTTTATGASCAAGWRELHPWLDRYQTYDGAGTCTATGTTGAWNAATGSSGGWQQWSVDLGAYAGTQVEISISYVSDWATQGLGVFVDDIEGPAGAGTTSFEGDSGGWTFAGPPAGSAPNPNEFGIETAAGFPEGAAVATKQTLYFGFGLEGIAGAANRAEIMREAMHHLLP